jgi:hypothetical protein
LRDSRKFMSIEQQASRGLGAGKAGEERVREKWVSGEGFQAKRKEAMRPPNLHPTSGCAIREIFIL